MVKKIQSFQDFEYTLKNECIDYITEEKCKSKVVTYEENLNRSRGKIGRKAVITVVVLAILSIGTVAYGESIVTFVNQLFNKKGTLIFQYSEIDDEQLRKDAAVKDIFNKYEKIENDIKSKLEPGEVEWFLVTETYELDKYCTPLAKRATFINLDEMKKSTTTEFKTPTQLPNGYFFKKGYISYEPMYGEGESYQIISEKLYKEAKESGKEYTTMKGKTSSAAEHIELIYENKYDNFIQIYITRCKYMMSGNAKNANVEKIKIGEEEALYIEDKVSGVEKLPSYIIYVDNSKDDGFTYEIHFHQNEHMKEAAIKMIESLK